MPSVRAKSITTAEEFFRLDLPQDERWELVEGEPLLSPSPDLKHQLVMKRLLLAVERWLEKNPVAVLVHDWDVKFEIDEVRRPDLVVALKRGGRLRLGAHGDGTPDWLVEILSPGQEDRDLREKKELYERCGVSEYWVVDYGKRRIHRFLPGKDGRYRAKIHEHGSLRSAVLKGFALRLRDLFKVLDELPE